MITTPQRRLPASGRRDRLATALPVIVLGLGLTAVLLVVLGEAPLTPTRLKDYAKPWIEPAPIGTTGPVRYTVPTPFESTAAHRAWGLTLALVLVYYGSAMAIGSRIVRALQGEDVWPAPVRVLAGFLPGYLMTLAPLQLAYAALPLRTASWVALGALPAVAVVLHRRSLAAIGRGGRPGAVVGLRTLGAATALVAVAAIHRLQQGVFFLTQDSITYYTDMALQQLDGRGQGYLLHWNTQTDEWLFNAPLSFSSTNPGDLWFPYYVTQSVSVAAFLCLVFGLVHRIARRRKGLAAAMAVAVTFGITTSIFPWVYIAIVNGAQPVLGLAHPGRLIGIVAPVVALLLLQAPRRAGWAAIGFLTLGLGFVTANDLMLVVAAVAAGVLWRATRGRAGVLGTRRRRAVLHGLVPVALGLPVLAFGFTSDPASSPVVPVVLLAASGAIALGLALAVASGTTRERRLRPNRVSVAWLAAWATTAAAGLVFSDTLSQSSLGGHVRSALATVLPGFGGEVVWRIDFPDSPTSGLSFPTLSTAACDAYVSCGGIPYFLVAYGVLLAVVLATWAGWGRLRPDAVDDNQRRIVLLAGIGALAMALTVVFFTGAALIPAGILTRLIEWPYYTLLLLGVLWFCEARHRTVMAIGVGFFAIWTLAPLVGARWYEEMAHNAAWYLDRVL